MRRHVPEEGGRYVKTFPGRRDKDVKGVVNIEVLATYLGVWDNQLLRGRECSLTGNMSLEMEMSKIADR